MCHRARGHCVTGIPDQEADAAPLSDLEVVPVNKTFDADVFRREAVMKRIAFEFSRSPRILAVVLILLAWSGWRATAGEPPLERQILLDPEASLAWTVAESTVKTSSVRTRAGRPAWHWHITVDHFAGEPKYPIGWPRASCVLRDAAARDWTEWDYFEFWVYTDTTRDALPREPVGLTLYTPDKPSAYHRPLTEIQKGQWVQVRIPVSQVPRHHDVRLMQFHISESQYRHEDQLDFYFDQIALARYAQPTLLEFAPEGDVRFADEKQLALRFNLAGIRSGERVEVVCELRKDKTTVARTTLEAVRGPQRVTFDLSRTKPAAGEYEVAARAAGGAEAAARVRLVESPWQ